MNADNYVVRSFIIYAFRKYYNRVNKYRAVRGARYVAYKREIKKIYRILVQKPKRIDHFGDIFMKDSSSSDWF